MTPRTLLLVGVAAALVPASPGPLAADTIDVLIRSPRPGQPVFGEVEIAVEILASEPVEEVVFAVDGRQVARFEGPPYRAQVDVGQANVEHRFTVVVRGKSGGVGRAERVTPPIAVDEKMDLELQQLYVTVTRGGSRILDLSRDQFAVYDGGDRQEIVTFEGGDVPLTAALLVDASFSMRGTRLATAVRGAETFVAEMKPLDEAILLLFSDSLLYATPFTQDPQELESALGQVTAQGGTAINDHLYLALKQLEARQGRRVVILLTDGVDVESALSMEQVLWAARRSQALIYWIRLDEGGGNHLAHFSSWRNAHGHRQELRLLSEAVEATGGRVVPITRLEDAPAAFREILRELREQYVIGYYPSKNDNDGDWHQVRVTAAGGGQVRTRDGYIDY